MTPYTFTIYAVPPSLNEWQRWHWAKRNKTKQVWTEIVCATLHEKGNVCPRFERVTLNACIMFQTKRNRDSDNYGSVLWKLVQDALVVDGVIPDDNAETCTSYPPVLLTGDRDETIIIVRGC